MALSRSVHSGDNVPHFGQGVRPQIGSLKTPVVGDAGPRLHGSTLDADIDLLPPVDRAVRELAADPGVATELRAVDVLDRELLLVGQLEEAPGHVEHGIRQLLRDPVSGQVEEADLVHGVAQVVRNREASSGPALKREKSRTGNDSSGILIVLFDELGKLGTVLAPMLRSQPRRSGIQMSN